VCQGLLTKLGSGERYEEIDSLSACSCDLDGSASLSVRNSTNLSLCIFCSTINPKVYCVPRKFVSALGSGS